MIDIQLIRDEPEKVIQASIDKGVKPDLAKKTVEEVHRLDHERRELIQEVEKLRAERNKLTKDDREKGIEIKKSLKDIEPELKKINDQLFRDFLPRIPNLYADDVPKGKDESENQVIRKWGEPTKFDFKPKDHLELGESLSIIEVKAAAKISGARFNFLKGDAALLEFALIQHALKTLSDKQILTKLAKKIDKDFSAKPFIPVVPPVMIRPEVFGKMARLKPEDERYYLEKDNLFLIGSAEHTLGPLHMDEIIPEKELPIRYVGFSTSFRREAGSYGKDTKGILRVHQFDKVEMESFTTAENSLKEQEFFVSIQEHLMQSLKIPYQAVMICTGDMGGPDYRQLDIEAWLPGQNKYRETHTADLMTDYQSRRLNTRILRKNTKEFAHMNDATAFAIGRTIIAILENFQQKDGSIKIPEVLQAYLGKKIIKAGS